MLQTKLGVAILRGMLWKFRKLINTLRYKPQKAKFIYNKRDVRYIGTLKWVGLARRYLKKRC